MPDNGNSMVTDFGALVKRVEEKSVVLPDFQREFVWKEEEMQRKLVASVLAKMPVGSILLLNGSPKDYNCKLIGRNTDVESNEHDKVDFLLDGQQRITVLSNVFSNVIFDNLSNFRQLVAPMALKRRFFLKLPKWINSDNEKDLFGVHALSFPTNYSEPDYLSGDVLPDIVVMSFTASDGNPYNPNVQLSTNLTGFCTNYQEGYLIPLFLLVPTGDDRRIQHIKLSMAKTISAIAESIATEIQHKLTDYEIGSDERNNLIDDVFRDSPDDAIRSIKGTNDPSVIGLALDDKKVVWKTSFWEYLQSCIREMRLTQIKVDGTQRARAIDIYENLNRGGVSLNTFDLIMARVATVDRTNFNKRIVGAMIGDKQYDESVVPDYIQGHIRPYINNRTYNATTWTGCYNDNKNEIVSRYIDVFLDVFGLYFNNQAFDPDGFKVDYMKRDKILQIDPHFIHDNCEKVIRSIDRALFFFQSRCGIRNIQEINYSLIIVLVATVFLSDEYYSKKKCHDLLEAWYWSVLFNGDYDKDQNTEMIRDLGFFFGTFKGERNTDWIKNKKDHVLDRQFFSDKDLLLMNRAETEERTPKAIIKNFVCQYFLAKTYTGMFDDSETISVFNPDSRDLEAHHIIPLGSVSSIGESTKALRNKETHVCNSPLNFVYITKADNLDIGSKSLPEYAQKVQATALSSLCIQRAFNTINFDDASDVKSVLENRFVSLQGDVKNRITACLNSWH